CGPEPVTDAGPEPPGPAAPLIGGSARDAPGQKRAHPAGGIEYRRPGEPRIYHDARTFDCKTAFGDIRCEDNFAPPRRIRQNGRFLLNEREVAVKRHDHG